MQHIVANLSGKIRRAMLGGREHIVAPLSLIVPGVLDGSKGPLYYPPEEVAKNPSVWNHTPIVVEHPKLNGQPVSARDPDVLTTQGVGVVLRAAANGKLTAEGWFDVGALRRVDQRILAALEAGKPIELSTGLHTDDEPAPEGSAHNGKPYTHIARNYRPDHLAVLPDGVGACSIADGCGVLVNEAEKIGLADAMLTLMMKPLKAAGFIDNVAWLKFHKDKSEKDLPSVLKTNKESEMTDQERKALVDYVVANCGYCDEEDRERITELSDDKLTAWRDDLKLNADAVKKIETLEATINELKAEKERAAGSTINKDDKPALTSEQQEDLAFARQVRQERRAEAIATITANEHNKLTEEQLGAMSLDTLQAVANSLPVKQGTMNYAGAAAPSGGSARTKEEDFAQFGLPEEYIEYAEAN